MGLGRDKVNGIYKVVRIFSDTNQFDILDLNIGEWRKLRIPPPCYVDPYRKSACVNGSIYWLEMYPELRMIALDLHIEEFRNLPTPPYCFRKPGQVVNLDDCVTIATAYEDNTTTDWKVYIWSLDVQEETWSMTYSFSLARSYRLQFCLMVSKQGHLLFHDFENRLFKYYPATDSLELLSCNICVISPFVENFSLFPKTMPSLTSRISNF